MASATEREKTIAKRLGTEAGLAGRPPEPMRDRAFVALLGTMTGGRRADQLRGAWSRGWIGTLGAERERDYDAEAEEAAWVSMMEKGLPMRMSGLGDVASTFDQIREGTVLRVRTLGNNAPREVTVLRAMDAGGAIKAWQVAVGRVLRRSSSAFLAGDGMRRGRVFFSAGAGRPTQEVADLQIIGQWSRGLGGLGGLESKLTAVLEAAGLRPGYDFFFSDGLNVSDAQVGREIVRALNASGQFAPARLVGMKVRLGAGLGGFIAGMFGGLSDVDPSLVATFDRLAVGDRVRVTMAPQGSSPAKSREVTITSLETLNTGTRVAYTTSGRTMPGNGPRGGVIELRRGPSYRGGAEEMTLTFQPTMMQYVQRVIGLEILGMVNGLGRR